jgi:hypothetical protein
VVHPLQELVVALGLVTTVVALVAPAVAVMVAIFLLHMVVMRFMQLQEQQILVLVAVAEFRKAVK